MRPLKYKNLGEMSITRVPQTALNVLPQLCDVMQQIEENGGDSCSLLLQVLDDIQERFN